MNHDIINRFRSLGDIHGPLDAIRIEPGTLADYRMLARFHYRSSNPGLVTSILRAVIDERSVIDRYLQQIGSPQVIGVLVRALPRLACRLRDDAVGERYRAMAPSEAASLINREIRTISRVIIDPRFRGCGVAVRLVRRALEHPEPRDCSDQPLRYTEALAAMGRICPFFERAGMRKYERPLRDESQRLLDALETLDISRPMLASAAIMRDRFAGLSGVQEAFLLREIRRWQRDAFRQRARSIELRSAQMLDLLQSELCKQPAYFIFRHELESREPRHETH